MRRSVLALLGVVTFLLVMGVRPAAAQPQFQTPSQSQPALSPYLNLLRRGSSPAVNYYGIVRPEQEFRNSYQRLQQEVDAEQQQPTPLAPEDVLGLPPTGHVSQFNTQGRYFMTRGAQGTTNAAPTGTTSFRPAAVAAPRNPGLRGRPPGM